MTEALALIRFAPYARADLTTGCPAPMLGRGSPEAPLYRCSAGTPRGTA